MSLKPTNELNGPDSPLTYRRRKASEVKIGNVNIGGENPIALQSMTSTSTMDTDGSVAQAARIIDAGGRIVRLTAQGVREAANLANIRRELSARGYSAPLVADIHFNPKAAEEAALHVEKVRINPGNFVDPGRTFKKIKFTDEEYAAELARIEARLVPFI
ncbi:MAG: flavodoxin-dependent (E)-4-hydroxy-3-methylbut-2-enyl-diphosphate synthase, partial [Muribaculaceae bacterium]|nr:flavodoxin-dependent (E)-4-hydroxy-3-methylbut-2-enyl-diphosphate synthase [Muribaculaceae bacterium]